MQEARARAHAAMPVIEPAGEYEEPAAFDKHAVEEQLVDEMERSLFVLRENDWVTDGQRDRMTALWVTSPFYTECFEARAAMRSLEKEPARKGGKSLALAKRHIKALRKRVDALCPAAKTPVAAKKRSVEKSQPMELTDRPPTAEAP